MRMRCPVEVAGPVFCREGEDAGNFENRAPEVVGTRSSVAQRMLRGLILSELDSAQAADPKLAVVYGRSMDSKDPIIGVRL